MATSKHAQGKAKHYMSGMDGGRGFMHKPGVMMPSSEDVFPNPPKKGKFPGKVAPHKASRPSNY